MAADVFTPHTSGNGTGDENPAPGVPNGHAPGFGNLQPILHQLGDALDRLIAEGTGSAIDLRAMPFSPGEEHELKVILGNGEVSALLKALGETELWETAYPGVWWVEHRNPEGERIAQSLEVTWIPDILRSQREDVEIGRQRLKVFLKASGETQHEET